jgi:hypothetical protein
MKAQFHTLCSLVYALSFAAVSCSGSKPATTETPAAAPASSAAAPAETPAAEPAKGETASADAGGSSEQADEIPKDCNFRVKGFCFAAEEDACAAAGCSAGRCMVLVEEKPAKIKCK